MVVVKIPITVVFMSQTGKALLCTPTRTKVPWSADKPGKKQRFALIERTM
jgi:hypothetical protein